MNIRTPYDKATAFLEEPLSSLFQLVQEDDGTFSIEPKDTTAYTFAVFDGKDGLRIQMPIVSKTYTEIVK